MGPKISHHRWSGRAYITYQGKRTYLGSWDGKYPIPKEIQSEYKRVVAALFSGQAEVDPVPRELTVAELAAQFLDVEASKLERSDRDRAARAAADLVRLAGRIEAKKLGPGHAKQLIATWVEVGLARSSINKNLRIVQRICRYGVASELIPPEVLVGVQSVPVLRQGLPGVRETPRVQPVSRDHVRETLFYLRPVPKAIISLLLTTGCRPAEACRIRMCDIDRSGQVWRYSPPKHKTSWRGKDRAIALGPAAQEVLLPWRSADPDRYLFSVSRTNKPYSVDALHHAVQRACEEGGIPRWSPRQIRKLVAQWLRDRVGIETAQAMLGHSSLTLTAEIYARDAWARAETAARAMPGL